MVSLMLVAAWSSLVARQLVLLHLRDEVHRVSQDVLVAVCRWQVDGPSQLFPIAFCSRYASRRWSLVLGVVGRRQVLVVLVERLL